MQYNICDAQALKKLVEVYDQTHFNNQVGLLDINLMIKYISPPLLRMLNNEVQDEPAQLYKMTLLERLHYFKRPPEIIQHIEQSLAKVINENCIVENIDVDLKRDMANLVLCFKFTPLYNRETNNIIAIETSASLLNSPLLLSEPCKLLKHGVFSTTKSNDPLLSRREHEVLFLQFQCKSAKEISQKLSDIYSKPVSYNTVGRITNSVYKKFKVFNHDQLLIEARKRGYHRKIPVTLLSDLNIGIQDLW